MPSSSSASSSVDGSDDDEVGTTTAAMETAKTPPKNAAQQKQPQKIKRAGFNVSIIAALVIIIEVVFSTTYFVKGEDDWNTPHRVGPNTTFISHVLNRLTDRSKYDKRLRPLYGEGPVDVGITIHVSSISAVSEKDMDFTLDFYLRQTWKDPRLAFGNFRSDFDEIESLTVGVDYLDRLWNPDTFFPNEKKSFFHVATTHNSFLRIEPDGRVYTSQRLTVTATCPMELRLFPMDTQTCKLEIESYGYTTADIDYFWGKRRTDPAVEAVAFGEFALPQFRRTGYRVNITKAKTASGEYVRLYFEIILNRALGFYLMNIIIPALLIVHVSWVSFWINRESSPARVTLGVTTVLTITTLITSTNNQMPKVSYIKSLDVFLNFCFVMVFAALVEYAVVSYMLKKLKQRREKRKKQLDDAAAAAKAATPQNSHPLNDVNKDYVYQAPRILYGGVNANEIIRPGHPMPMDSDCRTIPLMQYAPYPHDISASEMIRPMQVVYTKQRRPTHCCRYVSPSKIDKCSRYMFPVIFFVFNIIYWFIMNLIATYTSRGDYVKFNDE